MRKRYRLTPAKAKTRRPSKLGGAAVFAALLAGVAIFGGGYLAMINSTASKGYELRQLESRVSELRTLEDRMELTVATERSVQAVEKKVQELGMVPTTEVEYVMATAPVAKR